LSEPISPSPTLGVETPAPVYTLWQMVGYMLRLGTLGFGGPVALALAGLLLYPLMVK
jgi:hypothetical protein